MFDLLVFWLLALLLFTASAAALYLGVFRAGGPKSGLKYKAFSGLGSGALSGAAWFFMYGHHYLGW